MTAPRTRLECTLERMPDDRVLEFVAFDRALGALRATAWPTVAGNVRASAAGAPLLLHFAPGRWLVPNPGVEAGQLIEAATLQGLGTCIDVTGKWVPMRLAGEEAVRVLSGAIDIRAVLDGRGCAAVCVFDCPAIVTTIGGGCLLWVTASYVAAFAAAIERQVTCAWSTIA